MGQPINVDIGELRRILADLTRAQTTIRDTVQQLRSSLAKANWNDPAGLAFENRLNEALRPLAQFDRQAEALKPVLNSKIRSLSEYLGR